MTEESIGSSLQLVKPPLYRSRGYMVLAILTAAATTATVLIARGPAPQVVPLVAAGCYLVSIVIIRAETARTLRG